MEQRPTARHAWITEILKGTFSQHEDAPTTLTLPTGETTHKIRIYGITVSKNELVIDDGTGSIPVQTYNTQPTEIGDPTLIIGKPRTYNQQTYIQAEIIKKIDPKWIELAKKQRSQNTETLKEKTIKTVKELDTGDGADYNLVLEKTGSEEQIIHLIATGELFETRPGRLKVLE